MGEGWSLGEKVMGSLILCQKEVSGVESYQFGSILACGSVASYSQTENNTLSPVVLQDQSQRGPQLYVRPSPVGCVQATSGAVQLWSLVELPMGAANGVWEGGRGWERGRAEGWTLAFRLSAS